jgi:uncharacterized protein (TIGR02246 family)
MTKPQRRFALLVLFATSSLAALRAGAQAADEERAIRALIESHSVALNNRDLAKASAVYSDDATIVTGSGQTYTGREGVDRWHAEAVNGPRPLVHYHPADTIRLYFLNATNAVADVQTEIPRPPGADGQPVPAVRVPLFIALVKRDGAWRIAAQRQEAAAPMP